MKAEPKAKLLNVGISRAAILLLIVIQLSISGVSSEGVELCDCDPNLPPMPSIETVTDPCEISPIDIGPIIPWPGPDFPGPLVPGPIVLWPDPIDPGKIQFFILRKPSNCAIIETSPPMLSWPLVTTAESYNVYLGKSQTFSESDFKGSVSDTFFWAVDQELEPGTYYWSVGVVTQDTVYDGIKWMFDIAMKPKDPDPADGIGRVKLPLLQWTSDPNTAYHEVYLGTSPEINETHLVAQQQGAFYFIPTDKKLGPGGELGMQPDTTYYWRVDEVFEDGTIVTGDVWSFTTEADTPTLVYPEPVAWWTFDEGIGDIAVDAVRWREGYIGGTPSWTAGAPGPDGAALNFDGFSNYVMTPFVRSPADGSLGVFCWIRGSSPGGVIVSQQDGLNWLMIDDSTTLVTELPDGEPFSSNRDMNMNEWQYVGVTWDGTNLVLYVNNEEVASASYTQRDRERLPNGLYIGGEAHLAPTRYWTGDIDDVQIYSEGRYVSIDELDVLKERQGNIFRDGYYTGPVTLEPVKIDLNFDKALAAVLRYGATRPEAEAFAASLGLVVADFDEPNRIVTLRLPYDTTRADVAEFAGVARQLLSGSPFVEIGLALNPPLADTSILVNDEFVVQFEGEITDDEIRTLTGDDVEIVEMNPFRQNEYLLRVDRNAGVDALEVANRYHENQLTVFGVPNLAIVPEFRGYEPNDPLFAEQWHLHSSDNGNTLENVGISADEAWGQGYMGDGVVIAVIDSTADSSHLDLSGNFWENPDETKDGDDTDGNGYVDDIHGSNFGYSEDSDKAHGIAVAGCIGAQMDNNLGITGSCPNAQLMLLRCNIWTYDQHLAFDYARTEGADVICCAWGYRQGISVPQDVNDAIYFAAEYGRDEKGCVIVFAMTNDEVDNSGPIPDISSLEEVIAVSGATDEGLCSGFGYGASLDILAPTSGGIRSIVTTDVWGNDGYNPGPVPGGSPNDLSDPNYTQLFGGTSAACATTAGVAGLVLSANQQLTRLEVQQILQITADKIDEENVLYDSTTGYNDAGTHGYGRINANNAVTEALKRR